jgi:Zn-dependent M28 family amino/carboxypeptidase
MLKPSGITIAPDVHPEQGHFYRSDHFSFAKVGIPSVSISGGLDLEGKPTGWGKQMADDYTEHRYHQPSDDYAHILTLDDAAQLGEIVYRFGFQLANAETIPTWNRDAESRAAREAALRGK